MNSTTSAPTLWRRSTLFGYRVHRWGASTCGGQVLALYARPEGRRWVKVGQVCQACGDVVMLQELEAAAHV
jgi:hypothetical protein